MANREHQRLTDATVVDAREFVREIIAKRVKQMPEAKIIRIKGNAIGRATSRRPVEPNGQEAALHNQR